MTDGFTYPTGIMFDVGAYAPSGLTWMYGPVDIGATAPGGDIRERVVPAELYHVILKEKRPAGAGPSRSGDSTAQKPPVPFGVPTPVGPSYPAAPLHMVVEQEPFEPEVTSCRLAVCPYGMDAGYEADDALPASP